MQGREKWMEGRGEREGGDGWKGEGRWMEGKGDMNGRERKDGWKEMDGRRDGWKGEGR